MSGSDVSSLQAFLARDNTIYPQGLITGYYGSLTASAVSNFQARNNMTTSGVVDATTLALINTQIGGGMTSTYGSATIGSIGVSASRTNATVSWNTSESAKGLVYYSTTPLSTYELENAVTVSGLTAMTDANMHTSQNVYLPNLQANSTYYYLIYATDQSGDVSVTWPKTFQTAN